LITRLVSPTLPWQGKAYAGKGILEAWR
jgi:hypothetical protein